MNEAALAAYDRDARKLFDKFESFDAAAIHAPLFPYLPTVPLKVIDIGAGSGRDAAYFHILGHQVTAVEPANGLRALGQARYPHLNWQNDILPDLEGITDTYDLTCCINVLMFLSPEQRQRALQRLLDITAPQSLIFLSLRLGPAYDAIERTDMAESELDILTQQASLVSRDDMPDPQTREGVHFLKLLYRKNG